MQPEQEEQPVSVDQPVPLALKDQADLPDQLEQQAPQERMEIQVRPVTVEQTVTLDNKDLVE